MIRNKFYKILIFLFVVSIFFIIFYTFKVRAKSSLSGRILLQTESNGEAWYVNPENEERYYMGRPNDAFKIMKILGIGITNKDLEKIPIEFMNLSGNDSDSDGLADIFEDAINTDKNNQDSDADGYDDIIEVFYGYNPNGSGVMNIDKKFSENQGGKIFLQVENHGEAWYVNPENNRRLFLGRPKDAFSIMKVLGLGITNKDLEKIKINNNFTFMPIYESNESNSVKEECENRNNDEDIDNIIIKEENEEEITNNKEEITNNIAYKSSEEIKENSTTTINEVQDNGGIVNCGINDEQCLRDNFDNCKKAILTYAMADYLDFNVEVIGPKDDLCEVKITFNNTPVPEWEGKEMICLVDNTKEIDKAIGNFENCFGELYDLLNLE